MRACERKKNLTWLHKPLMSVKVWVRSSDRNLWSSICKT